MKASKKPLEKSVICGIERSFVVVSYGFTSFSVYPLLKLPDLLKMSENKKKINLQNRPFKITNFSKITPTLGLGKIIVIVNKSIFKKLCFIV